MLTHYTLRPTYYDFKILNHFPALTPGKKAGIFLSGGMESSLISIIAQQLYGKDNVMFFFSDDIFSSGDPNRNTYIRTNLARAEKLLNVPLTYLEFDYEQHMTNRRVSIENKMDWIASEYDVQFVMFGFTKLFFEVEAFRQDGMTLDEIYRITEENSAAYKSTIEEFHLPTGEYTSHLLEIDIPPDVYPILCPKPGGFILSPFKDINKSEVVDLYHQMGLLDVLYQTSSCIRHDLTTIGKHCGHCFNCQQRYDAFQILDTGVKDKTDYNSDEIVHRRKKLVEAMNVHRKT